MDPGSLLCTEGAPVEEANPSFRAWQGKDFSIHGERCSLVQSLGFAWEEQPLVMQGQPHAKGLNWDWDFSSLHGQF